MTDPFDLVPHVIRRLELGDRERILKMRRQPDRMPSVLRLEQDAPHDEYLFANRMHRLGVFECFPHRYQSKAEYQLTDLGERLAAGFAIGDDAPSTEEIDVRDEVEELIVERWRCAMDEGNGPECPAASPCPECATRKVALSLLNHRFQKATDR